MKHKKHETQEGLLLKAFRKANRELEFERNGGGQWVSQERTWKNKKAYCRKDQKESLRKSLGDSFFFNTDSSFFSVTEFSKPLYMYNN